MPAYKEQELGLFDLFDDKSKTTTSSTVKLRDMDQLNRGEGDLAQSARESQGAQFGELEQLLTRGGMSQAEGDLDQARMAQLDLAQMLRGAQAGPSEQDTIRAQKFAQDIFAPQQEALSQTFRDQETETARLAARLGRTVDDPILRARLAQSQADQTRMLGAQQGAFTAQTAQGFQNQALQLQNQLAQVRGGLASQALQNRQALMGMGQSLLTQERNFRLATANKQTTQTGTSEGGFGDLIGAAGGIASSVAGLRKAGFWGGDGKDK